MPVDRGDVGIELRLSCSSPRTLPHPRRSSPARAAPSDDGSSPGPLRARIAAESPDLGPTLDTAAGPGQDLFARGDQWLFARRGIPAVAITTGPHEDHHQPTDELGHIDTNKAARVARLVFLAAYELAMGAEVEWTDAGRRAVR